jgi:hypothetical protein
MANDNKTQNLLSPELFNEWLNSRNKQSSDIGSQRDKLGIESTLLGDNKPALDGQGLVKAGLDVLPQAGAVTGGLMGAGLGGLGAIPAAGMGAAAGEGLKQLGEKYLLDESPEMTTQQRIHAISGQGLAGGMQELPGAGGGLVLGAMGAVDRPNWMKVIEGEGKASPKVDAEDIGMYPIKGENAKPSYEEIQQKIKGSNSFSKRPDADQVLANAEKETAAYQKPMSRIGSDQPISQPQTKDENGIIADLKKRYDDRPGAVDQMSLKAKENNTPYHFDPKVMPIPVPNYEVTGSSIGKSRINDSTFDDPLKWMDTKYGATKSWMEKNQDKPITINTSSDLIARDDYAKLLHPDSKVNLYNTTDNDKINRLIFPSNASSARVTNAYNKLKDMGVDVNLIQPTKQDIIDTLVGRGIKAKDVNQWVESHAGKSLDDMIADKDISLRSDLKPVPTK